MNYCSFKFMCGRCCFLFKAFLNLFQWDKPDSCENIQCDYHWRRPDRNCYRDDDQAVLINRATKLDKTNTHR
jgi:hypothetical protein